VVRGRDITTEPVTVPAGAEPVLEAA